MTLSVKDALGATQTIKTNDDMAGVAGTPSANVLSVQGVAGGSILGVSVTNLPATQPVSGSVAVSNLPATQAVTGTFWQATQPVSLASTPGLTDTQLRANAVPVSMATTPGLTDTQLRASAVPVSGSVAVSNLPSTQAVTGTFWQATQPVSLASTPGLTDTQLRASAVPVSLGSGTNTIGGVTRVPSATQTMPSRARIASAASTNATSVKASAGGVYHIVAANMATAARFLKLYDKASAPTVGTDTPIATIYLPANGGFAELFDIPMGFTTGIAYAITALVADTDTTAVALNDIHGFILYA